MKYCFIFLIFCLSKQVNAQEDIVKSAVNLFVQSIVEHEEGVYYELILDKDSMIEIMIGKLPESVSRENKAAMKRDLTKNYEAVVISEFSAVYHELFNSILEYDIDLTDAVYTYEAIGEEENLILVSIELNHSTFDLLTFYLREIKGAYFLSSPEIVLSER